jgi:hypothetical protein
MVDMKTPGIDVRPLRELTGNETFNEAKSVFVRIGDAGAPALVEALGSDDLYVRCHAREVLARIGFPGDRAAIRAALVRGLSAPNPIDRRTCSVALGTLGDASTETELRALVGDRDPDVVCAAATALARLQDAGAVPWIERALRAARYSEARRALAVALADLGSKAGIPALLGLPDPTRSSARISSRASSRRPASTSATRRRSEGERLEAIARLWGWWEKSGASIALHPSRPQDPMREHAFDLVESLAAARIPTRR